MAKGNPKIKKVRGSTWPGGHQLCQGDEFGGNIQLQWRILSGWSLSPASEPLQSRGHIHLSESNGETRCDATFSACMCHACGNTHPCIPTRK